MTARIESYSIREQRGFMARPQQNRNARWCERRGLLLTLVDAEGRRGVGEASPLPGYSRDTLESAHAALARLDVRSLEPLEPGPALLEGLRALDAHVPSSEPAARHALETALVDLSSRKRNEPFETTLVRAIEWPGEAGARRALTAWIGSALDPELAERAEAALSRGVRTLKVKIGTPEALEAEVLALQRLRRRLGPDALLRLDANQAFERAEAAILFRELAGLDIELLEEPLKAPLASSVSCSCPVALDESLAQVRSLHDVRPRLAELNVKAVVLKPMALGGLLRALTLSREANELGLDVIVSHLLDGPVALGAAASLSLAVGSVERAQGLELHAGLSAWPACDVATVTDTAVIGGARAGHGVEVPPS